METFAGSIISFCRDLDFKNPLPPGINVMNPFRDEKVFNTVRAFYNKYYNDSRKRRLIIGINPGRHGAGVTGIPFTDTTRLAEFCGLEIEGLSSFETSSVFVYELIAKYGGPEKFYSDYYITSVSPLGFTRNTEKGGEVNYNYYDSRELEASVKPFAIECLKKQLEFGIYTDVCFCLGTGKNYRFVSRLNEELGIFGQVIPLEHPRYIMQYKLKSKEKYLADFTLKLQSRAKIS